MIRERTIWVSIHLEREIELMSAISHATDYLATRILKKKILGSTIAPLASFSEKITFAPDLVKRSRCAQHKCSY